MDTNQVKLFDHNNHLVPNFDEEIEKILISIHGENYYDTDEELVNTNLIPIKEVIKENQNEEELERTVEFVDSLVTDDAPKIKLVNEDSKKEKVKIKDFAPLLFFVIIFGIIVFAGYYFLNTVDLVSLIK